MNVFMSVCLSVCNSLHVTSSYQSFAATLQHAHILHSSDAPFRLPCQNESGWTEMIGVQKLLYRLIYV